LKCSGPGNKRRQHKAPSRERSEYKPKKAKREGVFETLARLGAAAAAKMGRHGPVGGPNDRRSMATMTKGKESIFQIGYEGQNLVCQGTKKKSSRDEKSGSSSNNDN